MTLSLSSSLAFCMSSMIWSAVRDFCDEVAFTAASGSVSSTPSSKLTVTCAALARGWGHVAELAGNVVPVRFFGQYRLRWPCSLQLKHRPVRISSSFSSVVICLARMRPGV